MNNAIITSAKEKMEKTISVFSTDLTHIRAGRANAHLLDPIKVDYYGTPTPITQMGNVSTPEPRVLLISLWDAKLIPEVEKAIQKSDIGINPIDDGKFIKLIFPELTQERRLELAKTLKKKGEEQKVAIRNIRRDGKESLKKSEKASEITEDDLELMEKELQKLTDGYIEKLDKMVAEKEKEIMSV